MWRRGAASSSSATPGIRKWSAPSGQIPGRIALVQNAQDVAALDIPDDAPVAYVTQTTLSVDDTLGIIDALHRRFSNIVGPDTRDICYATQNRQSAARELCRSVDVLLVVGARQQLQFQPAARDRRGNGRAELSRRRRRANCGRNGFWARARWA